MGPAPVAVVVCGVSGVGKSTVARRVADRVGCSFIEADDLHPPGNIAKLTAQEALSDADRLPWLASVRDRIDELAESGGSVVVACSALRRAHRAVLREASTEVRFAQLQAPLAQVRGQLESRQGHFMGATLLESQFATLEPLTAGESGAAFDARAPLEDIATRIIARLIG